VSDGSVWVKVFPTTDGPGDPTADAGWDVLSVFGTDSAAILTWPNAPGAASYDIAVDGAVENVGLVNQFLKSGLTNGQQYSCNVRPVGSTGPGGWALKKNVTPALPNDATGGTETLVENYNGTGKWAKVHTFTADGTFTVNVANGPFRALVVGGGGGGGNGGGGWASVGGGGGGGEAWEGDLALTAGQHTVTIGAGGASDTKGGDTTLSSVTARGGGYGGDDKGRVGQGDATVGGAGGGGDERAGGTATPGQGADGGDGGSLKTVGGAGGGGGATGTPGGGWETGVGGIGRVTTITGASAQYGNGGPGGVSGVEGPAGAPNTGQGGGGGKPDTSGAGGTGGSGVVVIAYEVPPPTFNVATGGTVTDVVDYNGTGQTWRIHTFTADDTFEVTAAPQPFRVLCQGGGGAGGGVDNNTHSNAGDGGYGTDDEYTIPPGSHSVLVGVGGAAQGWGYAGQYGGTGGPSSLGSIVTANGGPGGASVSGDAGGYNGPTRGPSSDITGATVQYGGGGVGNWSYGTVQNPVQPGTGRGGDGGRNANPQLQGVAGSSGVVIIAYWIG
jgi:hypothetical protein